MAVTVHHAWLLALIAFSKGQGRGDGMRGEALRVARPYRLRTCSARVRLVMSRRPSGGRRLRRPSVCAAACGCVEVAPMHVMCISPARGRARRIPERPELFEIFSCSTLPGTAR